MYTDINNELYSDSLIEMQTEKKYMSRFFRWFSIGFLISFVAVIVFNFTFQFMFEVLNLAPDIGNHIINLVSSLHTPLLFVVLYISVGKNNQLKHPVMDKMTLPVFVSIVIICIFLMAVGAIVGNLFSLIINSLTGSDSQNVVTEVITEMSIFEVVLYAVVLAPIFEELIFRKLIVDYFSKYGTTFCIFLSCFMFASFHGNFYQFFYALAVGALFAFVYSVYGKIWHTILLHAILNFCGSVIPMLLGLAGEEIPEITMGLATYFIGYMFAVIVGAVLFFVNIRKAKFYYTAGVLFKPYRVLFKTPAFIIAVFIIAIMFITSFISV